MKNKIALISLLLMIGLGSAVADFTFAVMSDTQNMADENDGEARIKEMTQ